MLIPAGILYALMVVPSRSTSEIRFADELDSVYGPVIHVNLLYRHGERTIDLLLPLDPYGHERYWPEGLGQLTKEGILHHYELGKWLAVRYAHLLPKDYRDIHKAISVQSTDFDRTIMSAQAQLAGMFSFNQGEDWKGLSHFPVPVHSVPEDEDNFLDVSKKCDRYDVLMNETKSSQRYQDVMEKYGEIVRLVKKNYDYDIKDMNGFQKIYGILQIEEGRGLALPEWVSKIYPSPLIEPTITSFKAPTWTEPLKRLKGGPVVKTFLKNFREKVSDPSGFRNVSSYSGHDTSISQLLDSMGIFNDAHPPMAAMVLMELRRKNQTAEPIVTISYKNSTNEPYLLVIPNCARGCPLDEMEAILKPIIPEDWEKECVVSIPI